MALDDLPGLLAAETPCPWRSCTAAASNYPDARGAGRIPTEFREGLRVTDEATMRVAEMVFAGEVNKALVRELYAMGYAAVGISGTDGPTLRVEPMPRGSVVWGAWRGGTRSRGDAVVGGFVPVVAPVGRCSNHFKHTEVSSPPE